MFDKIYAKYASKKTLSALQTHRLCRLSLLHCPEIWKHKQSNFSILINQYVDEKSEEKNGVNCNV